ncbi:hypothetical protein EBZ37_11235 [bacterium]|jgi:hypothetical protein|nr:hypothetical protein [bacterium]
MHTRPFDPRTWSEKVIWYRDTLRGLGVYRPNAFEQMRKGYAKYSERYWEGVEERKYKYRYMKKIEARLFG